LDQEIANRIGQFDTVYADNLKQQLRNGFNDLLNQNYAKIRQFASDELQKKMDECINGQQWSEQITDNFCQFMIKMESMLHTYGMDKRKNTMAIQEIDESWKNVTTIIMDINRLTDEKSKESVTIISLIIIALILWNMTLTIVCVYLWCSSSKQQSQSTHDYDTSDYYMETPYNSTTIETTDEQLPTNCWPCAKRVEPNPIYQMTVGQSQDEQNSEI
jgi:hypothetical protein